MPRVSVVIRCYGHAALLPQAVGSVVRQTYADWECVVVNDGSPDDTSGAFRALAAAHPGRALRLVEQENRGPPGALDAGIAAATGELVLPLDADDLLHGTFLEKTVAALDRDPGAGVAFTDVLLFEDGGAARRALMGPFDLASLAERNRLVVTSLFRRRLWEEAGGFSDDLSAGYEDWDFWLSCAERGVRAVHVAEPLAFYRVKGGAGGARSNAALAHDASLRALLVRRHPKAYSPAARALAERVLAESPPPRRPRRDAQEDA
ncbi:MAG: glycosyltransferase family A protein [Anaeromyxobacter sp.]